MDDLDRRIGRLWVSVELEQENAEGVHAVLDMLGFTTLRHHLNHGSVYEYVGTSPMFDIVPEWDEPALYDILVETDGERNIVNVSARAR